MDVAPISQIKQGNWDYVHERTQKGKGRVKMVKIIIETNLLTPGRVRVVELAFARA